MPIAVTASPAWSRWHSLGAAVLAGLLAVPVLTIPRHIPLSYNEGWNAYFAARAIDPAAGPLYPPAAALIGNNYPPLSFYLIGAAGRAVGDPLVAGRIVALAALLAACGLTGVAARRLGGTAASGAAAALIMLGYAAILAPAYVATDDPQWLAHAVMLMALVLLTGKRTAPAVAAAAALTVAALFIKHNLVALPLAATLWLAWRDRGAAAVWCASGIVAAGVAALLAYRVFGDALVDGVLHHARVFDPARLPGATAVALLLTPLAAGAAALWPLRMRPGPGFALVFAGLALPLGIIQRGGEGVSYNAYFEALIALSIVFGLALAAAPARLGRWTIGPRALVIIALLPLAAYLPRAVSASAISLITLDQRAAAWEALERRAAATPGPVACELLAICFWAGKDFTWDFFNEGQRLRLGASPEPVLARLRSHDFTAIILTRPPGFGASDGERLPRPLPRAIEAAYVPAMAVGDTVMMVPRIQASR